MKLDLRTTARLVWVVVIALVATGSLSPASSFLMRSVAHLHVQDKVLHFVAYIFLASCPVLGIRRKWEALVGAGSMVLLGVLLEIGQHFVPGRTPDIADGLANTLGVACGIVLAFPFRAWHDSGSFPSRSS